jgi:hypothetical protein
MRGNPAVTSIIGANGRARTVLARTNATVILEVLEAMNAQLRPCVVGGADDIKRLLSDVFELKKNKPGICPEFFGYESWQEVVDFSETEEGEDLRTFVQLVEQHGERKLWAAASSVEGKEERADVILSTAHKAKGREWDSVRLAPDFLSSRLNGVDPTAEAEVRLFYVAMTRAKQHLSVDPDLLATFTSGTWRTRRPEPRQSTSKARVVAPPRPPPLPAAHQRDNRGNERRSEAPAVGEVAPTIPVRVVRPTSAGTRTDDGQRHVQQAQRRWWQFWV